MTGERTTATDEDSQIVDRFQHGESAAFNILFDRYQDYVYHIIYGIVGSAEEARDLTQDVFVQVYRSLPRFRKGSRFATWIYRIAVNRGVDAARASRRWRFLSILDVPALSEQMADSSDEPEAVAVQREERDAIQRILMQCPLNHRDVLVLRYYRGLSVDEIADTLGCTLSAAKVRLHRARKIFRDACVSTPGFDLSMCESDGAATDG